jgi:hypothetical protein
LNFEVRKVVIGRERAAIISRRQWQHFPTPTPAQETFGINSISSALQISSPSLPKLNSLKKEKKTPASSHELHTHSNFSVNPRHGLSNRLRKLSSDL